MKTALFITTLLLAPSVDAGSDMTTVPDRFVGRWAESAGFCGSDADDLTLRIGPRHITYWESDGPIRAVVVRGDTKIALIAELSGESKTWLSTAQFTLSQDGSQLIDKATALGEDLVRYRCSGSVSARSNNSFKPNPLRGSA